MSSSVDWVYSVYKSRFKGPVCMKACWKKNKTIFMLMFVVFLLPPNTKQIYTLGYCRYIKAQYGHLHVNKNDCLLETVKLNAHPLDPFKCNTSALSPVQIQSETPLCCVKQIPQGLGRHSAPTIEKEKKNQQFERTWTV